jgi:capsular polysaccharide biosynthesis protein
MFELTAILWRRKLLVLAVAISVFVIGVIAVFATRTTSYTASSQILFDQPALDVTQNGAAVPSKIVNLMPTFCKLVGSNEVAAAAGASAGVSPGVAGSVRCTPEPNTLVALLQYTSSNGATAQKIVASVSDQLVSAVEQRYDPPGTPAGFHLSAQVIQSAQAGRNSHGTVRGLGLVTIAAIILAAAFTLAVEPHRRDWDTIEAFTDQQIAVHASQND